MFGSDIIRIKVKGYLRNITDNEIFEFEERGIKNKDKITFNNNDIKYSIKCNDNEIMMIRDGNDIVNTVFEQVDYIRQKRVLEAKAKINKMPIKISVVSVIFFIPLLFLILLSPLIIKLLS